MQSSQGGLPRLGQTFWKVCSRWQFWTFLPFFLKKKLRNGARFEVGGFLFLFLGFSFSVLGASDTRSDGYVLCAMLMAVRVNDVSEVNDVRDA